LSIEEKGLALRYGVFSPDDVTKTVKLLDKLPETYRLFIPDGRATHESLQIVSAILAMTQRALAGSGVIRLLEHDPSLLARRLQTIQAFSSNRCFLGVGTGSPGNQPANTIQSLIQKLDEVRSAFDKSPPSVEAPEVWVAALRQGIASRVMSKADGLILNFCTPEHASKVIAALGNRTGEPRVACYLKLFYASKSNDAARRLLVQEFLNYDSIPHYHQMFLQDSTAGSIARFRQSNDWKDHEFELPDQLLKVSLANPSSRELATYVTSFKEAGVDLPVIYPYFPEDERQSFKLQTVSRICRSA
jgi:alkanesulfonate monooxygenase SsuD/methylene tetrahydromethanopterin reductase-like flavin-dependent oxidoreductase (luciferase family)